MGLFFLPFQPVLVFPPLALVPALAFGAIWWRRRSRGRPAPRAALVAAVVWGAYAIYEMVMHEWSKSVIAPIRIDLLLLVPVLYARVVGAVALWRSARHG